MRVERWVAKGQALGHRHLKCHKRSTAQIECYFDERFIEWKRATGKPADARFVAECFAKRFTQADGNIFDGVVGVDVQVALGFDFKVKPTVLAKLVEHVVKKWNASVDAGRCRAVEIDEYINRGFFGGA